MQKLTKNIDYHFLVRVLNNKVSPEEKEFFEEWLAESEKSREDFSSVTLLWDKIANAKCPPLPDPELQWEKISNSVYKQKQANLYEQQKIAAEKNNANEALVYQLDGYQTGFLRSIFSSKMFQAATVLLIITITGMFFFKFDLSQKKNGAQIIPTAPRLIEVKSRKGEKISLTLSDGSKVYLNNYSKLTYPEFFDEKNRNVELEGEAYFAVTPNKNKPFRVKSGNTLTVVRGTEFNIKNRGESISVIVIKGSVDTYNPKSEKIYNLKKGDLISYNDRTGFSLPQKVDVQKFLAWRKDKFSFNKTPLKEVMEEIERYYNVNIIFKSDSLKNKTISGEFRSDSIKNILSIISLTLDLKIKINNRNIIVDKY